MTQYLNKMRIRNTTFTEGVRILATSKSEAEVLVVKAYNVITKAGWAIEKNKSDKPNEAAKMKKLPGIPEFITFAGLSHAAFQQEL